MMTGDTMTGDHMMMATGAMMDDTMKKDDTMMKNDDSMKNDTMMKDDHMMMKDYKKLTVALLAKKMGYTWKTDRKMLAEKAGVTNYKGTAKQNIKIRTYLLSMAK